LRRRGGWPRIRVGINIGKSRVTPMERAVEDYVFSFRKLRAHADYIALNVSSPNTPGLRDLQGSQRLDELLRAINAERAKTPLLVKIAPDLEAAELDQHHGGSFRDRSRRRRRVERRAVAQKINRDHSAHRSEDKNSNHWMRRNSRSRIGT
jgi:hypothetical protein